MNARVDYQVSASDQVFGVLHRQWARYISYPGNLIVGPEGEQIGRGDDYSFTAGWTRTMTPTLLNSLRFGYMHRIGHRTNLGQGSTSPGDFGLQGIPACLSSVPDTAGGQKCGTPGVNVTGYQSFSTGGILYEPADTLQISDSITTLIGRHSLKAGGEARHYAIDNYQPNGVAGSFTFSGSQTGHAFADFLFGRLNTGSVEVQNAMVSTRAWSYALFVQDDFKVTPTLTLNLGLRWQYDQSFRELNHGLAFFNPFDAEWEQFGVNAPETTFDPSWKQFGPRVGIAWNPARTIVVRAGYGITYPSAVGHGRAGDGQPGPNLLARTPIAAGHDLVEPAVHHQPGSGGNHRAHPGEQQRVVLVVGAPRADAAALPPLERRRSRNSSGPPRWSRRPTWAATAATCPSTTPTTSVSRRPNRRRSSAMAQRPARIVRSRPSA